MVKGYVEAKVTRTEEIRGRVEKAIPEFIVPDDVKYLLTALQKVEADRNRYIQRAGTAEWRLEVMEADLQALREENARLKGALEIAFVQGAQWWEYERTSFTMWGDDRNRAEAEAAQLNAAGTLGMTYEERMKRAAALSPSPAQQEEK